MSKSDRDSVEIVVEKVKAWLETPGAIESLRPAFEAAEKLNKELSARANVIVYRQPRYTFNRSGPGTCRPTIRRF